VKLIVIGAGIAGSCLARLAREAGIDVTVVAQEGKPDSLAATAILRRGYHAGKREELEAWDYAVECYERWGVHMQRGGAVSSYRRVGAEAREDADWLLLDPAVPLVKADAEDEVVSVHGGRVWFGPGRGITGDAVVVAGGARSNLSSEDGKITWGLTWVHQEDALKEPEKLKVYQYAPYRTIVGGAAGGMARVGSSSSVTEAGAVEQGEKMLRTAWDLGWLRTRNGWEMRVGARLKTERRWWRTEDGHWEVGGFHRTGYALAPRTAQEIIDNIKMSLDM
jgi:hypothetical protein